MWGGTKVPAGMVACQEKLWSVQFFGTYVWPRMLQEIPCMPSLARVIPVISLFIALFPSQCLVGRRAILGVTVAVIIENLFDNLGLEFSVGAFCDLRQVEVLDWITVRIELEASAQRAEIGLLERGR